MELGTEEKIKIAAKKVFYEKGFAATRTRDIAAEADLNLALLNYYFRSKKKLFDVIMMETLSNFFQMITILLNDTNTTFETKIELAVSKYIDLLIAEPNIPFFLLGESRNSNAETLMKIPMDKNFPFNTVFFQQYKEKTQREDVTQFGLNLASLIIFPFMMKNSLTIRRGHSNKDFENMMLDRKKLIPVWINALL